MKVVSTKDNLQIIYEDNHIIAINKRVGDIVQGDKTGDAPLSDVIKEYLKTKYNKPGNVYLGVVHRLDRPTTGIVVFAKTSKALSRLNALFKNRETKKVYRAVIKKSTIAKEGKLKHYLKKNPKNNTSTAHNTPVDGSKEAVLEYKVVEEIDNYILLEILLHTGRHHQIRSQLSAINHPIKGDLKYGYNRSNPDGGINLHAYKLTFEHPVKKELIELTAELPQQNIWEKFS